MGFDIDNRPVIGLMGGSFNPVHLGHIAIASYLSQWSYVDKVWFLLSPQNPLKERDELISDAVRLEMLSIAVSNSDGMSVCDIELSMPRPSYTIDTLRLLSERYPMYRFKLIIGSDNWLIFDRWKDYSEILNEYGVIVFPRPGYLVENTSIEGVTFVDAPTFDISSTFIRRAIAEGKNIRHFVPEGVSQYIIKNNLYGYRCDTES